MADVDGGRLPAAVDEELRALTVLRDHGRLTADEFERRAVVVVCKAAAVWDRGTPASRPPAPVPARRTAPVLRPVPASTPTSGDAVVALAGNLWMVAQRSGSEREPVAAAV